MTARERSILAANRRPANLGPTGDPFSGKPTATADRVACGRVISCTKTLSLRGAMFAVAVGLPLNGRGQLRTPSGNVTTAAVPSLQITNSLPSGSTTGLTAGTKFARTLSVGRSFGPRFAPVAGSSVQKLPP